MFTRSLGVSGPTSSAIGLGCMGMSDFYGPSDRSESIAAIRAALDANVTLLDTGDFYGMGHNEMLISEAIQSRPRDQIILSVKFGAQRNPAGKWVGFDGRPAAVKTALAYTLKRLGKDHIDIYRPARLDPNVPIEDTVGAIAEMVKAGYVATSPNTPSFPFKIKCCVDQLRPPTKADIAAHPPASCWWDERVLADAQ